MYVGIIYRFVDASFSGEKKNPSETLFVITLYMKTHRDRHDKGNNVVGGSY